MTGVTIMTETEFQDLLDRYGADPGRWPADLAASAERAMKADRALARQLSAEQALMQVLAEPVPVARTALRRTVLDIPLDHPRGSRAPSAWVLLMAAWRQWMAGTATATAAALVGVVLGYGQMVPLPLADTAMVSATDDVTTLLSLTVDGDLSDLEVSE